MYEYYFTGRKPSNAQVLKKINEGINQGNDYIEISWGENMLTLEKQLINGKREAWIGWGWIRNISGSDIAVKINSVQHNNLLNLWNT
jgi:hypothetical protein